MLLTYQPYQICQGNLMWSSQKTFIFYFYVYSVIYICLFPLFSLNCFGEGRVPNQGLSGGAECWWCSTSFWWEQLSVCPRSREGMVTAAQSCVWEGLPSAPKLHQEALGCFSIPIIEVNSGILTVHPLSVQNRQQCCNLNLMHSWFRGNSCISCTKLLTFGFL